MDAAADTRLCERVLPREYLPHGREAYHGRHGLSLRVRVAARVIELIRDGTVLYAYHPSARESTLAAR